MWPPTSTSYGPGCRGSNPSRCGFPGGGGAGGYQVVSLAEVPSRVSARVGIRALTVGWAGGSGACCVDVLVQSSLRQARIADGGRRVGGGVDVVGHVGARLVDVEAVVVVVGAGFTRVGAWHQVAGVGPGGHDDAAHRGDVDVVAPEPKPPGAVGLPAEVAARRGDLGFSPAGATVAGLGHEGVDHVPGILPAGRVTGWQVG